MTPIDVLHVDNHVLAVRKPAGMPCVPDESRDESLFDRARSWIEQEFQKPGKAFLGVVHRLDRPVSGVVVFGRTSKGAARLSTAFAEQRTAKLYWGVATAGQAREHGAIRQHLWKDRTRNRVEVVPEGRQGAKLAVTHWCVLECRSQRVLHELRPTTGRSHQLRVAMASMGRPLVGDLRYGPEPALPDRSIGLHARALMVPHPTQNHSLLLTAAPPRLDAWSFDAAVGARSGAYVLEGAQEASALAELVSAKEAQGE